MKWLRSRWVLGTLFGLMAIAGWFAGPGNLRWGMNRTAALAYRLYDPVSLVPVNMGPQPAYGSFEAPAKRTPRPSRMGAGPSRPLSEAERASLPAVAPFEWNRWLREQIPQASIRIEQQNNMSLPAGNIPFAHEPVTSAPSRAFAAKATELLTDPADVCPRTLSPQADPFLLCERIRALTKHGQFVTELKQVQPRGCLEAALAGKKMSCRYFSLLHLATCVQKGYTARMVGLSQFGDHWDHAVVEVYLPQLGKWVLIDPDYNLAYQSEGIWCNALELQRAWRALRDQVGDSRDMPSVHQTLSENKQQIDAWTSIRAVPLSDVAAEFRRTNMAEISCTGRNLEFFQYVVYDTKNDFLTHNYPKGHPRSNTQIVLGSEGELAVPALCPEAYAVFDVNEVYWPVGRSRIDFVETDIDPKSPSIACRLQTWMPNFAFFEVRHDAEQWQIVTSDHFDWKIHEGTNVLEVRAVNRPGLRGETAFVRLNVDHPGGEPVYFKTAHLSPSQRRSKSDSGNRSQVEASIAGKAAIGDPAEMERARLKEALDAVGTVSGTAGGEADERLDLFDPASPPVQKDQ